MLKSNLFPKLEILCGLSHHFICFTPQSCLSVLLWWPRMLCLTCASHHFPHFISDLICPFLCNSTVDGATGLSQLPSMVWSLPKTQKRGRKGCQWDYYTVGRTIMICWYEMGTWNMSRLSIRVPAATAHSMAHIYKFPFSFHGCILWSCYVLMMLQLLLHRSYWNHSHGHFGNLEIWS